jgi:hypothetical protein
MEDIDNLAIKQIKLSSGEDIVAYVQSFDSYGCVIERPVKVECSQGGAVYHFSNWMTLCESKEPLFIPLGAIITSGNCSKEVKETYIKQVTSQASPEVDTDIPEEQTYKGTKTFH